MAPGLRVFLTIDVGPDDAILGQGHSTSAGWDRTAAGLVIVRDVFRTIQDEFDASLKATWFLRADNLIAQQFGDRLGVHKRFADFWKERLHEGHEIGWMPQVYASGGSAVNHDDLPATHAALADAGALPTSVRMGDCFHDDETMATLARLGVRIDCSALPGRKRDDSGFRIDWVGTPEEAYHPSVANYRVPGTPHLEILELPLSVMPIRAPYDTAPLLRYVNPCMRREFFRPGLNRLIESSQYLVCVLHPDEVVANPGGHPLIAYSADELEFNLRELLTQASRLGTEPSVETIESFNSA